MTEGDLLRELYESIGQDPAHYHTDDVARLEVHHNRVLGAHLVPGLEVEVDEKPDGIAAEIVVKRGAKIEKPVWFCFGMIPETGLQKIDLDIRTEEDSKVSIVAHCTFPNAVDVKHFMDAVIHVGANSEYAYFERHVHGPGGGVHVVPRAKVTVAEGARFATEFELIRGRAGRIEFDYDCVVKAHATLEMVARIGGRGDDRILLREAARLEGDYSRGVLTTNIALRDRAEARVENTLVATGAFARGHVDCKEIVQDQGVAAAIPIVEVRNPKAHVTHEAAIGSVDSKQLETLMSRGLREDAAVDLIIQGLLSPRG